MTSWLLNLIKSDLQDSADRGRKRLVNVDGRKIWRFSFDHWNKCGAVYLKRDGSVVDEKWSFKKVECSSSSKLDGDLALK